MIAVRRKPKTIFDTETGLLLRSGNERPLAPELIDLKVTNKCNAHCEFCYMSSNTNGKHASYDWIMKQMLSFDEPPLQIAVGGGEPTLWPELLQFVAGCRSLDIVVNTAVGPSANLNVIQEIVQPNMMGALGISYVDQKSFEKILNVVQAGHSQIVAHCILRKDWMQQWISMAEKWGEMVDGVTFLLFKPHGLAKNNKNLIPTINEIHELLAVYKGADIDVGFDSCSTASLRGWVEEECIDECDGGYYSLFMDGVTQSCGHCSFLPTAFDLKRITVGQAWKQMSKIQDCPYVLEEKQND